MATWLKWTWLNYAMALVVGGIPVVGYPQQTIERDAKPILGAPAEINRDFVDPNLDVDRFVQRFELESREIYHGRREIVRACRVQTGWRVADIGAGTGFFTKMFAAEVGDSGWVYALEISPRFVEHIRNELDAAGIRNVSPVLTSSRFARLPPRDVNLVFICDTYHHFEFPEETLASIHSALVPGGELVIIDFERIEGVSREWVLGHVRGGKSDFRSEIERAGFEFVEELPILAFAENYMLRFRKPPAPSD